MFIFACDSDSLSAGQESDAISHENSPFVFAFQTFPTSSTVDGPVAWEDKPIVFMRNGNGCGNARLSLYQYMDKQIKEQFYVGVCLARALGYRHIYIALLVMKICSEGAFGTK